MASERPSFLPSSDFGGIDKKYSDIKTSKTIILPIPYEQTTSYKMGTKNGPKAILEASQYVELYDEELEKEPYKVGIHTTGYLEPTAKGPQEMVDIISCVTADLLKKDKPLVSLGGEHSITPGIVKAYCEKYKDMAVLYLDAHADLRDEYQGTKHNHACAAKRIIEHAPLVQVGIRSLSQEEAEFIKKNKLNIFWAKDCLNFKEVIPKIISQLPQNVYITIDLDVFDPSIMPSVGTPEPGGLNWYDVLSLLREVAKSRNVVGFDVVELCPNAGNIAPDFLAAKLVYKLIGYLFA